MPIWFEQVETVGNDFRDSRGWSLTVVYLVLLGGGQAPDRPDALWLNINSGESGKLCTELDLAYDHACLLETALERLCSKVQYSTLPLYLLPSSFTLSDIHKVFCCILGKAPPLRSLRNRFVDSGVLEDTGHKRHGSNRPATLYTIKRQAEAHLFNRLYQTTL